MVDSGTETGETEEEIRTTCGARKKENDIKYVFKRQSRQFKGAPSGRVWGTLSVGKSTSSSIV